MISQIDSPYPALTDPVADIMTQYTIVEKVSDHMYYHCGYCESSLACAKGLWAHAMNALDYQALIDRGWRRSGKYCYKPIMNTTCCPQYTIRCGILDFKPTKSKRKVIKKMRDFLMTEGDDALNKWKAKHQAGSQSASHEALHKTPETDSSHMETGDPQCAESHERRKEISKGAGPDPSKPRCIKAKVMRQQRSKKTLMASGDSSTCGSSSKDAQSSELILPHNETNPDFKRTFEVRMVRACVEDSEFQKYRSESFSVYRKYQTVIHGDEPSECTEKQWIRFLVDCPLNRDSDGPGPGYGNYHQHYVLDGKIIAVGVIDILPHCVSSVYLFYDPDYGFLSMGVYTALSEIAFSRSLHSQSAQLNYYYMGFYIHGCQKMRYKREYPPSYLLCPETYEWVPVQLCLETLDKTKYSRLNVLNGGSTIIGDPERGSRSDVDKIAVLYQRCITTYVLYARHKYPLVSSSEGEDDADEGDGESRRKRRQLQRMKDEITDLEDYVAAVGTSCASRMLLHRATRD